MANEIHHYVDGQPATSDVLAPGGEHRHGDVFNPATGEVTGHVPLASSAVVDAVVASSRQAAQSWRDSSLALRSSIMFAFRHILASRTDTLARAISAEHGKVVADAAGEVARALENVEFACGVTSHLQGAFNDQVSAGIDVHTIRQPLGVAAGITPFNFPAMVPAWMFATAIACGNTFIAKPSERDPSASMLLAQWLTEAGLPPGVFNVVHGDATAVEALIDHPDVAAVSFVGSTPIAQQVHARATAHNKRVQALGGAKNHMVVLADADVDVAADAAVSAAYGSAGERCMAVSALVAVGDVADALVDAIAKRIGDLRVGAPDDEGVDMGPLVTAEHRDKVAGYVERARTQGATVTVDPSDTPVPAAGFYLGPALLDDVTAAMECYRDEIFGPVLSVVRVDTFDEALELVRTNPFGNGAAVFTSNGGAAREFVRRVEAGMVGVNVPIPVPVAYHSFGGWKNSLFGDVHMYGPEGVRFFTRAKAITTRWPDPATSTVDLGFPTTDR